MKLKKVFLIPACLGIFSLGFSYLPEESSTVAIQDLKLIEEKIVATNSQPNINETDDYIIYGFDRYGRYGRYGRWDRYGRYGRWDRYGRYGRWDRYGRYGRWGGRYGRWDDDDDNFRSSSARDNEVTYSRTIPLPQLSMR